MGLAAPGEINYDSLVPKEVPMFQGFVIVQRMGCGDENGFYIITPQGEDIGPWPTYEAARIKRDVIIALKKDIRELTDQIALLDRDCPTTLH